MEIDNETNNGDGEKLLPEDVPTMEKLLVIAKRLNILGWAVSLSSTAVIILNWSNFTWIHYILLMVILFGGQGLRFYSRVLQRRAVNPITTASPRKLKKFGKEQKEIVREFMENHPEIARDVVKMRRLASEGKYKDAVAIINKLLRRSGTYPKAVVLFLKNRKRKYIGFIRRKT